VSDSRAAVNDVKGNVVRLFEGVTGTRTNNEKSLDFPRGCVQRKQICLASATCPIRISNRDR